MRAPRLPILLALSADQALAAATGPEPVGAGALAQVALALALVLALLGGAAWLLRRLGRIPGAGAGAVRVLGGVALGARERLVLVEVGGTQLLLGVAPGRVQTLHVLERPVAATPAGQGEGGFAARLRGAMGRGRTEDGGP